MNPTMYKFAKIISDDLNSRASQASDVLKAVRSQYPTSPMGLTPDAVRVLPEFIAAKKGYDTIFKELRAFNGWYAFAFAKEIRAEFAVSLKKGMI